MKTYDTNQDLKDKIDKYLSENASIEAELGTDSTPEERQNAKKKQRYRMDRIKELDQVFWAEIRGFEV